MGRSLDFPFDETRDDSGDFVRTFDANVDENELVWHRDREDRIIRPTHETNWQFQLDNELPVNIDREIFIPAGMYHRIIKGSNSLTLSVTKIGN
jgi:hypothetical protein